MRRTLRGLAAAPVLAVLVLTACSAMPSAPPESPRVKVPDLDTEVSSGSSMSGEQNDLVTEITQRFGDEPAFSGFEWESDTGTLALWWFDEPPVDLVSALESSSVEVEVRATLHPPAELRAAAQRILVAGSVPGVRVSAVGPAIDGTRLDVLAELDDGVTTDQARERLEEFAGFPIELELGSVTPLTG